MSDELDVAQVAQIEMEIVNGIETLVVDAGYSLGDVQDLVDNTLAGLERDGR
jgi:hypothetical protein